MTEPEYYSQNGLSPLNAMKQGLISHEEYLGFIKGNIIKYVIRAGKKDDPLNDIDKAMDYLKHLKKGFEKETTIYTDSRIRGKND